MPDPSTSRLPTFHDYAMFVDPWAAASVADPSTLPSCLEGMAHITEVSTDSEWSDDQSSDKTVAPAWKGKEVASKRSLVDEVCFNLIL
jgi:hypothetical protein